MCEPRPEDAPARTREPPHDAAPDAGSSPAPAPPAHFAPPANSYALFGVKRLWSGLAALCLLAAAVLGWRGLYDATFVVATLGVVAWFLDQRHLLRARSIEADADEAGAEIDERDE